MIRFERSVGRCERTRPFRRIASAVVLSLAAITGAQAEEPDTVQAPHRIIFSTDIAAGLIDTHGGMSLTPVPFDPDHDYTTDANVNPQDTDDGMTYMAALNMDAAGLLEVLGIVPMYGNASQPPEMLVARQITQTLKGRKDIPIVPGAREPAGQILNPTATWFDGSTVKVTGRNGSFAVACPNLGTQFIIDTLKSASAFGERGKVTLLSLGPVTDVACVLQTAPKAALRNIREIVFVASQMEGEETTINGLPINDFNIRMDPLGAAMLLEADRVDVPLRFMTFQLTGQTSQSDEAFVFMRSTYPGPPKPASQADKRSFRWLLQATKPQREFFISRFGNGEGPFAQYTLFGAVRPDLFKCEDGYAYIQMCPYPAWSRKYPTDGEGNPTQEPYNAPDNPCTSHGTEYGEELSTVPAQLMITTKKSRRGALIRGKSGIDGNLPQFSDRKGRRVTVCLDFAHKDSRTAFEDLLKRWVW